VVIRVVASIKVVAIILKLSIKVALVFMMRNIIEVRVSVVWGIEVHPLFMVIAWVLVMVPSLLFIIIVVGWWAVYVRVGHVREVLIVVRLRVVLLLEMMVWLRLRMMCCDM